MTSKYLGALILALLTTVATVSYAGSNAGSTVTLSWDQESLVADRPATSEPVRLFARFTGLTSISSLALKFQWSPEGSMVGYSAIADSVGTMNCSRQVPASSVGSFAGDNTYDWSITGLPPSCVSLLLTPPMNPIPARFCLSEARVVDSFGAIDNILVLNSATIRGGGGTQCPPNISAVTPAITTTDTALSLTIVGNGLEGLASIAIENGHTVERGDVVSMLGTNVATVHFPRIPPGHSLDLVAEGESGGRDTLARAITRDDAPQATYTPLLSLPGYNLGNTVAQPWSPNGRYLCLRKSDGLYVFDVTAPLQTPKRILTEASQYYEWSPDGSWLLCKTQEDPKTDLYSLIMVSIEGGDTTTIVRRADIRKFTWGTDGNVYLWQAHGRAVRQLRPHSYQTAGGDSSRAVKPSYAWVPGPRQGRGAIHRIDPRTGRDSVLSALSDRRLNLVVLDGMTPTTNTMLARVYEVDRSPYSALLNEDGSLIRELTLPNGNLAFTPTGLTHDGRYVVGFGEEYEGEGITAAPLFIADLEGAWVARVTGAPNAWFPRISPNSYMLALFDPVTGATNVGTLSISR